MVPEEKIKVRIKFSKVGNLMYISHLDLARTMQRIILRAGLDIWYTEGFNPQPKMVFAVPLPTGVESECELLDIKLNSYMSCEEIKERLNNSFPPEMRALEVYNPDVKLKEIQYIDYTIKITSPKITDKTTKEIESLLTNKCVLLKKTKSGEKEVDISEYIAKIQTQGSENSVILNAIIASGGDKNLSPELLIEAIRKYLGIMTSTSTDEYYSIMRNKMLYQNLDEFR